ncbi:Dolichol phosphate-mannose biosynthesis regulatory [Trypanosoma melophagium]|uniref:Dolichol phosphate-mannose biosynthesis regulatory n=1 Tax=Trypanosoma melophagium TaxID=715481 RepID=UPI00351A9CC1|nr:Dolichol phosphate-mannose biosynthesis regulatory [Trypanosoma melophagium]
MLYDRTIAKFLLPLSTVLYAYYIVWIAVTPFIDPSHFTQRLFPSREYGLLLAAAVMTIGLCLTMTAASVHTIRQTGMRRELPVVYTTTTTTTALVEREETRGRF